LTFKREGDDEEEEASFVVAFNDVERLLAPGLEEETRASTEDIRQRKPSKASKKLQFIRLL